MMRKNHATQRRHAAHMLVLSALGTLLNTPAAAQLEELKAPEQTTLSPAQQAALPLRQRLDQHTIHAAVSEILNAEAQQAEHEVGGVLSGRNEATGQQSFSKQFDAARKPGCLRPDGLKFQPTFVFGGLLALPFIAVAKLRGKCS